MDRSDGDESAPGEIHRGEDTDLARAEAEDISLPEGADQPDEEARKEQKALEEEEREEDLAFQRVKRESFERDVENREKFAARVFWLTCVWMVLVLGVLVAQGWGENLGFDLSDSVLITLISTTTANVIALLVIVMRYLFPKR